MTIRERIADWISGGALSYARETIKLERSQRQYRYSAKFMPLVLAEGAEARAAAMEESLRATAAHSARKREQGMICISHWVPKHRRDEIKAAIAKMLDDDPAQDQINETTKFAPRHTV